MVRDADELHDALMNLVAISVEDARDWAQWFDDLLANGRATVVTANDRQLWIASERWPLIQEVYGVATSEPSVTLPMELNQPVELTQGRRPQL